MIHCNERLKVKTCELKCILCDSLCHTTTSIPRLFFCILVCLGALFFSFSVFLLNFILFGRGRLQEQRTDMKGQGDEWNQNE